MSGTSALLHEVSCRFLTPLLEVAEEEGKGEGLRSLAAAWQVTIADLRDESNWISLAFCEALVDWLGAEIGADRLASKVTEATFSPRALGVMYPLLRAFGSPRVGYAALPQVASRLTKVSTVRVGDVRRGSAQIEYRPTAPDKKARSPLICHLRKAQIAAGPSLWGLPPARVDEGECQSRGGDRCVYSVKWVERASFRGTLIGLAAGAALSLALPHALPVVLTALIAGGAAGRIWDLGAHRRELQAFVEEHTTALAKALDTVETRFVELQAAKAEVDARVEQRTAELRVATERRVHTEKLAVLGTLAAGLAHEVRNPANTIINGLRPVRRQLESLGVDGDYVHAVDIAIDAGEQIAGLVGDLLDVGRTDRGLEPWNPDQGLEAAIRLLGQRAQHVSFERELRFQGEIVGRPPALNQIFLNLLDNAVRAAGDGGRVQVTSRAERGGVEIVVSDSGPGVPTDVASRIFDPFFTTRDVGDGAGLGLHFSRQVAYDHGGSLDLIARTGWGASFRLWLPAHPPEQAISA
jgi:signal transduction histidine kinase